jgi:hypothetical protein
MNIDLRLRAESGSGHRDGIGTEVDEGNDELAI